MSRGGRDKTEERAGGMDRRCVATGESAPRFGLIRFVLDPEGIPVPDLAEKLPGRGVWISAEREAVAKAVSKGLFSRGFKRKVTAPEHLPESLERLICRRLIDSVALARKAGLAVCGFERTKDALLGGDVAVLFAASDGAEGGKSKLRGRAEDASIVSVLTAAELGLAFGRETVIHAALKSGGATERAIREARRLAGFRPAASRRDPQSEATAMS